VRVPLLLLMLASPAYAEEPLVLEAKIPLGDVSGRIDHLAVDVDRRRVIVAELGNDTVGIVDLAKREIVGRIRGLKEPQGVAYLKAQDVIVVANAGDGTVRRYRGADLAPMGMLKLGADADNIRLDPRTGDVVVGYGRGTLSFLDPASGALKSEIELPAHPESFQLAPTDDRIFVNVPDAHQIAVLDRGVGRQVAQWGITASGNFPMALDPAGTTLFVVYRSPPTLTAFDGATGGVAMRMRTCGDADDVFFDAKRARLYVSCGDGEIAVIQQDGSSYREIARIGTSSGARTALFVPPLDRLVLAVRARGRELPALWIYRPAS
jgi:DNA-binding beta-propeller fold protein YncE